jgi:hypothetical protein
MKNVHNAFANTVSKYKNNVLEYDVILENPNESLWVVNVYNRDAPGSLLQIEVMDDEGIPICCVLQKVNVGRRSMARFMDRLMDALD